MDSIDIFDPNEEPNLLVFFGKCKSGKTHTVSDQLNEALKLNKLQFGLIFSMTAVFNNDYPMVDKRFIIEGYKENVLVKYIKKLRQFRIDNKGKLPPRNFVIFDDVIGSLKNSDFLKSFIITYRHTNTTLIISTQFPSAISTISRELISYAFAFRTTSYQGLQALYKAIGGGFRKFNDFVDALKEATREQYACLVFNPQGSELDDMYFSYKSPPKINYVKKKFKTKIDTNQIYEYNAEDEETSD